jgi:hypothetical protein
MLFKTSLSLGFLAMASTVFAGIDLSPATSERVLDGIKFQQLIFRDGERKISYEPPRGWKYRADSGQLKLAPPDIAQAQGTIEQSPLSAPQSFDEPTIKALHEKTLASVPNGSQDAAIIAEEKDPVLVNRNSTYEMTAGYRFGGQDYRLSVLYVNLPDTQLRFRFVARKADFEKLHNAFRGSVFSWQWNRDASPTTVVRK